MRVHTLYADAGTAVIQIENLADEEMEGVFEIYARPMADPSDESRKKVGLVNDGAVTTVSPHATVTLPITLLPAEHLEIALEFGATPGARRAVLTGHGSWPRRLTGLEARP